MIGAYQSQGATFGFIDDVVVLGSTQLELLSYAEFDSGSGRLSNPFGSGSNPSYQGCQGTVSVEATV